MSRIDRRRFIAGLGGTALAGGGALAAQKEDPAHLNGADRTQRLIAAAKKEGVVTLYSSAVAEHMNAVAAAFEKTYGIRVKTWRGGSEEVLQRAVTEARGGRFDMDVVETAAMQIIAIGREKLLEPVQTPLASELMPQAIIPGEPWLPTRIVVFTGAYNTRLIAPQDLPKSLDDLLNPKWRGKLGIEADDNNWLAALCGAIGEEKGLKLFGDIVAKNGMSVRKGHTLLANLVASGEVPMALSVYYHEVEPLKRSGAPVAELNIPPVFSFATGAGLAKRAPHPYGGVLFIDFLLLQGQQILAQHENIPANLKYQHLPANLRLAFMDVPKYMAESGKWAKLYKELLSRQRH
jgi:iron(III) transport system substrate-binding protein